MSSFPENFIAADRVNCASATGSKKRILEAAGHLLAHANPELDEQDIFNKLLERERLGSTGFGHGVALPHARIAGIDQAYGCFLRLSEPVDFDAIDDAPVDLVFALLAPEAATDEHLRILSTLASLFGDTHFRDALRNAECTHPEQFLQILDAQNTTADST
ncbi:MAG TPA: PTS sugar transporter subunit IIA [Chromatiaceae bacterium]|nr:PTS sugar transporter subunit IIA [Chromatiaceae bacterium]